MDNSLLAKKELTKLLIFVLTLVSASCLATYYFFQQNKQSAVSSSGSIRDFERTPFSMSDAYEYCIDETKQQLGTSFQRYAMDNMSTHFNEAKQEYLIVLKVDIGSISEYREASIYCNVDPRKHVVSAYKEVFPGENRSILAMTMDFFSGL